MSFSSTTLDHVEEFVTVVSILIKTVAEWCSGAVMVTLLETGYCYYQRVYCSTAEVLAVARDYCFCSLMITNAMEMMAVVVEEMILMKEYRPMLATVRIHVTTIAMVLCNSLMMLAMDTVVAEPVERKIIAVCVDANMFLAVVVITVTVTGF